MNVRNVSEMVLVQAIVRAVTAVALVGVVVWSVIAEVAIDDALLKVVFAVLAAYFGISARSTWTRYRSRKRGDGDG